MHFSSVFVISILCRAALSESEAHVVVHEHRNIDSPYEHELVQRSRAPGDARIRVRVALKQRNLESGHDLLMAKSDPESPSFGQHLSYEEIRELFEPHEDSIRAVRDWLVAEGVAIDRHAWSSGRGTIKFEASIAEVESLLQTEYHVFEHFVTGHQHVATNSYHLPRDIRSHIDFVAPTVQFHPLSENHPRRTGNKIKWTRDGPSTATASSHERRQQSSSNLTDCGELATTACIRAMYGIPRGSSNITGNEIGVFAHDDTWAGADLDKFFSEYPETGVPVGTRPIVRSIDGGVAPVPPNQTLLGGEADADFEMTMPLVYPQSAVDFQVDANPKSGGYLDTFLDALDASFCTYRGGDDPSIDPVYPSAGWPHPEMCGAYKPTNVITVSYSEYEFALPHLYQERLCYEFMKLGLAGVSLFFSSGDFGPHCNSTSGVPTFSPKLSGSCPYVTSVGATQLPVNVPVTAQQEAAVLHQTGFQSGGGFSNTFARPEYQASAVQKYLDSHNPKLPSGTFNLTGRGYPDVSAIGLNVAIYSGGITGASGTSLSTPIWASIITLVNERRLAAGKSTVGFINPTLYKNPHMFTDIVSGGNLNTTFAGSSPACTGLGFNATAGWDPVTGLGIPKFDELLKVFMALP